MGKGERSTINNFLLLVALIAVSAGGLCLIHDGIVGGQSTTITERAGRDRGIAITTNRLISAPPKDETKTKKKEIRKRRKK